MALCSPRGKSPLCEWDLPIASCAKNQTSLLRDAVNTSNTQSAPKSFNVVKPRLHLPVMRGVIDRRMLVNFRCQPSVLQKLLPEPFRPKLVQGWGMAGICLIRLKELRPQWMSMPFGFASENAAHRIAVEWDDAGRRCEGVFIPRRDTSSRLNTLVGGRLFPGIHHFARFEVKESSNSFELDMHGQNCETKVSIAARLADEWPPGSVFATLDEASAFFADGSLGWSAGNRTGEFDGLELESFGWRTEPLIVERVESSFFHDESLFPPGTVEFDGALLMRGIQHQWHGRGRMAYHREPSEA